MKSLLVSGLWLIKPSQRLYSHIRRHVLRSCLFIVFSKIIVAKEERREGKTAQEVTAGATARYECATKLLRPTCFFRTQYEFAYIRTHKRNILEFILGTLLTRKISFQYRMIRPITFYNIRT